MHKVCPCIYWKTQMTNTVQGFPPENRLAGGGKDKGLPYSESPEPPEWRRPHGMSTPWKPASLSRGAPHPEKAKSETNVLVSKQVSYTRLLCVCLLLF